MRLTILVALLALCLTSVTASLSELTAALPSCALACFVKAIPQSGCGATNQTCMCTNTEFTETVELCVASSCTIHQSLATKNVTQTACGAPIRDRTKLVSVTGVVGGVLALLVFIMRICARLPYFGGQLGADDWTMALAMCCIIPLSALSYILADNGLGKDMWTVPFEKITRVLYIYFFDELLYLTAIALTKISILCFYLRVFPRREIRTIVYIAIGLNVGYIIAFVLISVFQCSPIKGAWHRWDAADEYNCNNINAQGWCAAALNMALDILVLGIPLKELYRLNMSWRKKLFVMGMFSLGIFVSLVSILRLESLIAFADTTNLTWDYVRLGYWSTIEVHVGVICACLPALRSLFQRFWPRVFGDTKKGTSYGPRSSRSRSMGAASELGGTHPDHDFVPLVDREGSSK